MNEGRQRLVQSIAGLATDRQKLVQWLAPPNTGLWKWAEDGQVIVWHDGSTITFRREIEMILREMGGNGLPPFCGLVILLAMCRGAVVPQMKHSPSWTSSSTYLYDYSVREIARFSRDVLATTRGKAVLAEMVFAHCMSFMGGEPVDANTLVDLLETSRFSAEELNAATSVDLSSDRLLQLFHLRLKEITPESFLLRVKTGLDDLPSASDADDLLPAERMKRFLDQLQDDQEHAGIARVARDIMAALQFPRKLNEMDDLAIGGFSDISNRGQLDRLLLSELAHDDLTLAVRVALNEALYIRREPPVRQPPMAMAILLDTGIRLWGIPRVLATSVALAVVAKDRTRVAVQVSRPIRGGIESADLFTRDGLVNHLGSLMTAPHPGYTLRAFFSSFHRRDIRTDAMIIVASDTFQDEEFRNALDKAAPDGGTVYVATVDRGGQFAMYQYPLKRQPPIVQAVIDVDKLFRPPKPGQVPLVNKAIDPDLPVILGMKPFPLLLPVLKHPRHVLCFDDGGGVAVVDRSLVWWKSQNRGVVMVLDDLPAGMVLFAQRWAPGVVRMVIGSGPAECTLLEIDLERGLKSEIRPEWDDDDRPSDFCVLPDGSLCFAASCSVYVVKWSANDKPFFLEMEYSGIQHVAGRYFKNYTHWFGDEWSYVHWDGEQAMWKDFPAPSPRVPFDRLGIEGQFYMTGVSIENFAGKQVYAFDGRYTLEKVSPDGHQLLVKNLDSNAVFVLHLKARRGAPELCMGNATFTLHDPLDLNRAPRLYQIRRRFESVGISGEGRIILATNKAKSWLELDLTGGQIVLKDTDRPGINFTGFQSVKSPGRYLLHGATWTSRTRFYLDSRGMLHLKSHDPSLPEVSIVLQEGRVAAWSSDGLLCGPAFYTDRNDAENDSQKWQAMWKRITDITQGAQ